MMKLTWNFNKNKLIILMMLLVGLLLISTASAMELDDNNLTDYNSDESSEAVQENTIDSFENLSKTINETPHEQTLTLDRDYNYIDGDKHGVVISKPMTIDGAGHTLDGKKSSRILNITADNVTLKNINFINGNALGFYYTFYGGGAIHWSGANGCLINCTFTSNSATGLEVDPYDPPEVVHYFEDGSSMVEYRYRPTGAPTNQGGAITWMGPNGRVYNCTFKNNHVAYPNSGGAIYWAGDDGKIFNSEFLYNSAYNGAAIYWFGKNGTITLSKSLNDGIADSGIFWAGENGIIKNSILLSAKGANAISPYSKPLTANYNFWGDTVEDPFKITKIPGLSNWILIDVTSQEFAFKDDEFRVYYDLTTLIFNSGKTYTYNGMKSKNGFDTCTADKNAFINASYEINRIKVELNEYNFTDDFIELALKIKDTPAGGVLVLDKNYSYIAGPNKGIIISKPITIDGAGHTLNGKGLSRIFNITSDNVTIKNINLLNGNAFGSYSTAYVGGGAIYWSGNNGNLLNCNLTGNHGNGIENDPYDKEEIIIFEDGMIMHTVSLRPMGASTNKGGAIVWDGANGTVDSCIFKGNAVGYPNAGGAVFWKGGNGSIINSQFHDNGAFVGSSIYWMGKNGFINSSKFIHTDMFNYEIYWSGDAGGIKNSIILSQNGYAPVSPHNGLNLDFNFWGDTLANASIIAKDQSIKYWYVLKDNISISDLTVINGSFIIMPNLNLSSDKEIISSEVKLGKSVKINANYNEMQITKNNALIKSDNKNPVKTKLITKNISKKVKSSAKFTVKVLNSKGKAFKKQIVKIKFKGKTYKLITNKKGIATFKIPKNLKKGKHAIKTTCNGITKTNKIIVKK